MSDMPQHSPPARPRPPGQRRSRSRREGPTTQELMRERLIESRLTPNAISLTGFILLERNQRLPMLDLSLFRNIGFAGANSTMLLVA